jgi:hypothetical protein
MNLVLLSPGFLALFFVVPALFLLSRFAPPLRSLHIPPGLMLLNNLGFVAVIALRFYSRLTRLRRGAPCDADPPPRGGGRPVSRAAAEVREALAGAGFRFAEGGGYGEKRNPALGAATVFYGGLLLVLAVGNLDYARQFSGTVLDGVGKPLALDSAGAYYRLTRGFMASPAGLPRLRIKGQIMPNAEWPYGASEIALLSPEGKELAAKTITWDGKPLVYKGMEYHMGRFLFDAALTITASNGYGEMNDFFKLAPIRGAEDRFTHEARFTGVRGEWRALFDPVRRELRLTCTRNGATLVNDDITFQKEPSKVMGGFSVKFLGLTSWSEIHVVRSRHIWLAVAGAVIAVIGGLARLIFRPQRVWLEETAEGCRVWAVGGEAKRLMRDEG